MKNGTAKTESLRSQSAWLLFAKIAGFALSFALPLVIVRYLTQEQVGLYREIFLVITNAVIILPLGFSMSAYYFLARETTRRGAAVLNILMFNLVAGGLACLVLNVYPELLGTLLRSDEITRLAPMAGVVIWIWIFSTFLETAAIANQEARMATAFIILASFSKTLLMGAAVFAFASVEAFLYAAMAQGVIQTAILLTYLRSRFPGFWTSFEPAFFVEQIRYALPFGLTGILWLAQYDIHNYFVAHKFTAAEFAIYAYGCFEVPLIGMLSESVTSVLIPRMNALQLAGDRDEMIRLTARAMQKLAFFYFPIYVFLMITAQTFITTLFTQQYAASASVFVIFLTLLPFSILVTDPVVRSFKELGRMFLLTRVLVLTGLVAVLYFGLDHLSMTGMVTVAVGAILIEKLIAETMVIKKLGIGREHLPLLKNVVKTAGISIFAGAVTYLFYANIHTYALNFGESLASGFLHETRSNARNLVGGLVVLAASGIVFSVAYLIPANLWGVIEEDEKQRLTALVRRVLPKGPATPLADAK